MFGGKNLKPHLKKYRIPDNVWSEIIEAARQKGNVTETYLKLKENVPPLESTKGINDVTDIFQTKFTAQQRAAIIAAIPDSINLNGGEKPSEMLRAWKLFLAILLLKRVSFENTDLYQQFLRAQELVQLYNSNITRKKNLPYDTYDALENAVFGFIEPIAVVTANITEVRDELLVSEVKKQDAFYQPLIQSSHLIRDNGQYIVDAKNEELQILLEPVQNLLKTLGRTIEDSNAAANIIPAGLAICAMNPKCCELPPDCPPTTLRNANILLGYK